MLVTTVGKRGYNVPVQNIYGVTPPPLEEHHDAIESFQATTQVMKNQRYDMEASEQANTDLTISNSAVTAQVVKLTASMGAIQDQLNTLF